MDQHSPHLPIILESLFMRKGNFSAEEQDALDYNGLSTLCLLIFHILDYCLN